MSWVPKVGEWVGHEDMNLPGKVTSVLWTSIDSNTKATPTAIDIRFTNGIVWSDVLLDSKVTQCELVPIDPDEMEYAPDTEPDMVNLTINTETRYVPVKQQWVSVDDDVPPINETVLAYTGFSVVMAARVCGSSITMAIKRSREWETRECCELSLESVTHWMPLPEPPSA